MEDPEGGETIANRDVETPVSRASEATPTGPDPTFTDSPDVVSPDLPPGGTGSPEPLLPGDTADSAKQEEDAGVVMANPQAEEQVEELTEKPAMEEKPPREEKPSEGAAVIEVNSAPEKEKVALATKEEKFVATE